MNELGSITALITAAGSVIGLANKSTSVEANQKILELQKRLSDVQQTFAELLQDNQNLKDENRRLQEEISAETMYPFRESVRWKKGNDGGRAVLFHMLRQGKAVDATAIQEQDGNARRLQLRVPRGTCAGAGDGP